MNIPKKRNVASFYIGNIYNFWANSVVKPPLEATTILT